MCRLALMNNAGIRYIQEKYGLLDLFDYLEMQLGGHGNGVCFIYNDGNYSIKKGLYLTNNEIAKDIMEQIDNLNWVIYHTRLAGNSPINDRNCHPFEHNGRVVAMNGNETDYTIVDDALTDTENILITTPNIAERAKHYDSVFVGYENGRVFAYKNAYSLECIKCENGGIAFASRFPIAYHETETIYEAPKHFTEGENPQLKIAKTEVSFIYGGETVAHTFHNSTLNAVLISEYASEAQGTNSKCTQTLEYPADIVITSGDTHAALTALTNAEAVVKQGGVIILFAKHIGIPTDANAVQALTALRQKATVICITETDADTLEKMRILPAADLESALYRARTIVKKNEPTIIAIPDGTAVVAKISSTNSVSQFTGCSRRQ